MLDCLLELEVLEYDELALLRAGYHLVVVEPAVIRELPVLLDALGLWQLLEATFLHAPYPPVAWPGGAQLLPVFRIEGDLLDGVV